jgi:hypothetical protein
VESARATVVIPMQANRTVATQQLKKIISSGSPSRHGRVRNLEVLDKGAVQHSTGSTIFEF